MQHLPRLMAARPWLESRGVSPVILVPPGHEKWQGRYLSTLGSLGQRVMPCRTGTVSVDELYYVPMLWDEGFLGPPTLYRQMQSCFRTFAGVVDTAPPSGRPIFVTRRDAPTRRLSNEAEIIDLCRRQLGEIDVMSLREVPFVEQIRRFAATPLVIGPQGQGLTNIIFSRQTRLLILEAGQSADLPGWADVYRDFAHMTDNSALRLLSGGPWPNDGDWEFPAAAFAAQLQRVVALGLHLHRPPVLI
jgi:capsular polysaccharide biosynthesis protein